MTLHFRFIAFTGMTTGSAVGIEFSPKENLDFPNDMVVSEKGELSWNTDATKVFFGIKEQKSDPKKNNSEKDGKDDDKNEREKTPLLDLDIWHWKDLRIQSVQHAYFHTNHPSSSPNSLSLSFEGFPVIKSHPLAS